MTKPQLVFVSGAWHVPAHFAPLESKLSALGYTCHIKQMPSVGSSNPPKDLSEDIAFIRSAVEKAIGPDGNDVVVLCHSWGGVVTGSALSRLSKKVREEGGQKGGVVRTGYMTAFMIPEGVSITDAIGGKKATWYDEEVLSRLLYSSFRPKRPIYANAPSRIPTLTPVSPTSSTTTSPPLSKSTGSPSSSRTL